jgi:membrane protease YdiL (CAAX protease family)
MSALAGARPERGATPAARASADAIARALAIAGLLALATGARATASLDGRVDGLVVGALFGTALVVIAVVGQRPSAIAWRSPQPGAIAWRRPAMGWNERRSPQPVGLVARLALPVGLGLAGGVALIGLALAVRWPGPWIPLRPAAALAPWALVTVVVATAEELVLRGALFDALEDGLGPAAALAGTTLAFALLHVPLYGWHVVPLDLGVGLVLGGLRLLSGGVGAPAIAHTLADLATWWL